MAVNYLDWRDYQEKVAVLFRNLGCIAETDLAVQGARAKHNIDVWVTFNQFGLVNKWLIECKYWKSRVSKEKVLALKSIVEDVGADRGILVGETGFQQGAFDSANTSNILLTTYTDLEVKVKDYLYINLLERLEKQTAFLQYEIHNLFVTEKVSSHMLKHSAKPGVDAKEATPKIGCLSMIDTGFKLIKLGKYPVPFNYDAQSSRIISAKNAEEFAIEVGKIVEQIQQWLVEQKLAIEKEIR